ncbi:MAG: FoF1 ATP synthase subunit gamma [Candidatus Omnitrophota bacterium]
MIPLVKLRENLQFARDLQEMIEVLKGATASQFRSLQNRRKGFEQFKATLEDFLATLVVRRPVHPFLRERASLPKAVLMITSDEGFMGSLNAMVVNAGLEQAGSEDELVVMGERGGRYVSENQRGDFTFLPGIGDDITYKRAVSVRDLLINRFLAKKIGSVWVAFPRFLSLTVQHVDVVRVLPCGDIFGTKERRARIDRPDTLLEPTEAKVIDYLVKAWMMQKLYDIFWESKLSECAARIIHLEGSYEEILSTNKKLVYEYFKHFHARSDKNIREIFASRLRWQRVPAEPKAIEGRQA